MAKVTGLAKRVGLQHRRYLQEQSHPPNQNPLWLTRLLLLNCELRSQCSDASPHISQPGVAGTKVA